MFAKVRPAPAEESKPKPAFLSAREQLVRCPTCHLNCGNRLCFQQALDDAKANRQTSVAGPRQGLARPPPAAAQKPATSKFIPPFKKDGADEPPCVSPGFAVQFTTTQRQ